MILDVEFNVESLIFEDWNTLLSSSQGMCSVLQVKEVEFIFLIVLLKNCICRCKNKRTTYISMKFSCFKKLGLGFDMLIEGWDTS